MPLLKDETWAIRSDVVQHECKGLPPNERLSIHGERRVAWDSVLRSHMPRLACKCGTFPLFITLFCNDGYVYFTAVLT